LLLLLCPGLLEQLAEEEQPGLLPDELAAGEQPPVLLLLYPSLLEQLAEEEQPGLTYLMSWLLGSRLLSSSSSAPASWSSWQKSSHLQSVQSPLLLHQQ
jgi:hypothetical protein